MPNITDQLMPYLQQIALEKQRLTERIEAQEHDGRQDEANLDKVRLNIVQVFETLAAADAAQCQGSAPAFAERYQQRFDTLPAPWKQRLARAIAHRDIQTQAVEEAKLETVTRLQAAFLKAKGELK
ncbi:MAG: hypothetical protein E7319_06990 [Clostridiales bacterium]|nr:hypothetical protein [Clostridiales bacterium]